MRKACGNRVESSGKPLHPNRVFEILHKTVISVIVAHEKQQETTVVQLTLPGVYHAVRRAR